MLLILDDEWGVVGAEVHMDAYGCLWMIMCHIVGDDVTAGGGMSSDDFGTLFNEDDLNPLIVTESCVDRAGIVKIF